MKSNCKVLFISFLVILVGCKATPDIKKNNTTPTIFTLIDTQQFGTKPNIIAVNKLFELDDKEKNKFNHFFDNPTNNKLSPHKRVFKYIDKKLKFFNYYGQTYTAQNTINNNAGNCISLAILTTAYAKLANIDVNYSEVTTAPVYFKNANFQLISNHVRTKLFDPNFKEATNTVYFYKPGIIIDYFPSRNSWGSGIVNEREFIAMYYRNLSATALQKDDLNLAAWNIVESLTFDASSISAINMLAVIYRNMGLFEKSEMVYQYGLTLDAENLNLLSNYHLLLSKLNRFDDANKIQVKIDNAKDPSPFRWLILADDYYQDNEYKRALKYYKKVIEIAPYLHHGYSGTAKSLFALDKKNMAKKFMVIALEKTHEATQAKLYKAKLAILSKY
ncbi:tetratricopeptide repeat protein [Pseudoalteromonas denitrificans]|uniref:Uncharacterized protein n=1 Tax=Pseudoalteromonas denitrificans DSM 6059 TaxID=1123010 RepID=A0A1I1H2R5_9GAMM|nr:hypothetical protein [Pseudoalteromonas denitrificans]SFC15743.1 hypothetical protein SAMN02745724_01051 [Pseudoalteromonas denitrificans DSM 6059]